MYWDIVEVENKGVRTFKVIFADGLTGEVVLDTSFCSGVFKPLLDDEILKQVRVENGVITWPNGLDLAPDTMHREINRSPERRYIVKGRLGSE